MLGWRRIKSAHFQGYGTEYNGHWIDMTVGRKARQKRSTSRGLGVDPQGECPWSELEC